MTAANAQPSYPEIRCLPGRQKRVRQGHPWAYSNEIALDADAKAQAVELRLELIEAERALLHQLLREGRLTDEARRRLERELDLEEAYLSMRTASRPDLPL